MQLLLKLAWRNIWRNSRRSVLTILAVSFATMLSVAMRGMQIGTWESLITNLVHTFTGYAQIQRPGYQKNPSLQLCFAYDDSLKSVLAKETSIVGFAPRVHADGLVSFGEQSLGAMIIGIAPETERSVSNVHTRVREGAFLSSDSAKDVVVGYKLLKNLNAHVGDRIVILAQGYDGSMGNMAYRISGSFKIGSPEFDGMAIFMGLTDLRELLGMTNQVHVVALALNDLQSIDAVSTSLGQRLQKNRFQLVEWGEVSPELKKHLELDDVSGKLFLGILIVIVAFGILNTVLMSVTERFREFGVVLSMGMDQKGLVVLVALETLFITLVGVMIGDIIAWCINYYIVVNPIAITGLESVEEQLGIEYKLLSTVRPSVFVNSSIAVLGISLLSCLYPAYRVWKLEPLKGLRFT